MKRHLIYNILALLCLVQTAVAQSFVHRQSATYQWPDDPLVLKNLQTWQDQKFGIILHWGLYSVPGIVESWQLTSEDWITPDPQRSYQDFKDWYWGLDRQFNPTQFDPRQWAAVARDAGMRYMVFTTKHHDGFCLFDSRQTDFTVMHSAFGSHPQANVARHVFDAFRKEGLMVGCYFSKPDWHSQDYWWDKRSTPNRFHNYSTAKYPERWARYKSFVYNQIDELMSGYGKLDILWLDGGWCTPPREDIGLDSIVANARRHQPGLIVVDRACPGRHENYQTPEQRIPDRQITTPWESCVTLTHDWGWTDHPVFKSPATIVAMLAEVVAKGGSLLLGVGPTPEGRLEDPAVQRLHEIGNWLRANGEAIYATVPTAVYSNRSSEVEGGVSDARSDNALPPVWFTAGKDGRNCYAIAVRTDSTTIPRTLQWCGNRPAKGCKMRLLDSGKVVRWTTDAHGVTRVVLPVGYEQACGVALRFECEQQPLYKDASQPVERRVEDLLGRMTVDEKVGQLLCPLGWPMWQRQAADGLPAKGKGEGSDRGRLALSPDFLRRMRQMPLGSLWAVQRADPWTRKTIETGLTPQEGAEVVTLLQRYAVDSTRLGIPLLLCEEAAHGVMALDATVFPTGLCQASTHNAELLERMGRAIGEELSLRGGNVAYGPVLDLARDPRWSRCEETLGEDPELTGRLGAAVVRGLQSSPSVASVLKHFIAYGVPTGGLNGEAAEVGPHTLQRDFLPPFRQAVEAGALGVMTSYNAVDGRPSTANGHLLREVLRNTWGFRGVTFSDLHSIEGICTSQRMARNRAEAAAMALQSGVDIDLEGNAYRPHLRRLLEQDSIALADLDRAVADVLRLKFRLGLFERWAATHDSSRRSGSARSASAALSPSAYEKLRDEHRQLARQVAREGTVLLKNDGALPLDRSRLRRIAVVGPNADNVYNQLGDYTAPQRRSDVVTVLDGIRRAAPDAEVLYVKGCDIRDTMHTDIPAAVEAARRSDVVVLVVGGSSARDFRTSYLDTGAASVAEVGPAVPDMDCGEGYDRATLSLLGHQNRLMQAVLDAASGPVVVVYIQGRPLDMTLPAQRANALLTAWYPGEQGGAAIADILFGDFNPTGSLPISIPRHVGQLPVYHGLQPAHPYIDLPSTPLFPFGFGLSY